MLKNFVFSMHSAVVREGAKEKCFARTQFLHVATSRSHQGPQATRCLQHDVVVSSFNR